MPTLNLKRCISDQEATLGVLSLDNRFLCMTLEDQHQDGPKVKHETRIPAGRYKVEPRTWGGFHQRYQKHKTIGPGHRGMLWLREVPEFSDILIHCGNDDDDTSGCILVGAPPPPGDDKIWVRSSVATYVLIYPRLIALAEAGDLWIEIEDCDHELHREPDSGSDIGTGEIPKILRRGATHSGDAPKPVD